MQLKLTRAEKNQLLSIARKTIASFLETGSVPEVAKISEGLQTICGCFVSLKREGTLRGCIGSFIGDKPLYRMVQEMAIAAATKDPRFYPLTRPELDDLSIEISVLSPLQKIDSFSEIVVGTHGLFIEKNLSRGVLLPQVATEQGWDRETFLAQTCLKAGLREDAWKENSSVSIFTALVFSEK